MRNKEHCVFPLELISHILCYTTPQDVIRWRTVSKWFRAVTHDRAIWAVLYANAPFIRPPGPFPSQSATSLEHALVRSARLAQSWTTGGLRAVLYKRTTFTGFHHENVELIGGRWLIALHRKQRILLHDVNADVKPQILWEQKERIGDCQWDTCSIMSEDGPFGEGCCRRTLIESCLDGESGALCDTVALDVPEFVFRNLRPRVSHIWSSHSPFLCIYETLVFDTRARVFYAFPKLQIALDETLSKFKSHERERNPRPENSHVILTNSYIFVFSRVWSWHPVKWLIQAFTVPDGDQILAQNRSSILRLSYEGLLFQFLGAPNDVIRNSVVDPITGSTGIKFISLWNDDDFHAECIDVTLPKLSPSNVLPMTVRSHVVTTKESVPLQFVHHNFGFDSAQGFASTGDGFARGMVELYPLSRVDADGSVLKQAVMKYTIDATQERCTGIVTQPSPLPAELEHFYSIGVCERGWPMVFDCIYGRVFYLTCVEGRRYLVDWEGKDRDVIVIDVE